MGALMTASQVAAHFGCSVRTVNRMAQTRELPALKRGKHWRFSAEAVAAYEAANTTTADVTPGVKSAAPQPVLTALPDLPADYVPVFPELWGMQANSAASPAAALGRSTNTKKRLSARN